MTENDIDSRIWDVRKDFIDWRTQHIQELGATTSENPETRQGALNTLNQVFSYDGREKIENSFNAIIKLQSEKAKQHGQLATQYFFDSKGTLTDGLEVIRRQAVEPLEEYLGFKASLQHQPVLPPSDMFASVGKWGDSEMSWDDKKAIASSCFAQLGLKDIADNILNHRQDDQAQEFWNGFEERLQQQGGLTGPISTAHELGHAVHFTLAGTSKIDPDVAEIVSLFTEALCTREMEKIATDRSQKMALLSNQLNTDVVYVGFANKFSFEKRAYDYAEHNPNEKVPVTELWTQANQELFGDSIRRDGKHGEDIDTGLMLWDHYIHVPAYSSSYPLGWAAAPKLIEKLDENPEQFQKTFKQILQQGNNITPEDFLMAFNIDISKEEFWKDRVDNMSQDIEALKTMHKNQMIEQYVPNRYSGAEVNSVISPSP